MIRKIPFVLCVLAFLAPLLMAEEVEDINLVRSRFFVDHAVFADTVDNRLEVYYKIFNDGLKYVKKGDKYVANFEISVIVVGDNDKQVTGRSVEKSYALDSYEQTRSETGYLINQIDVRVSPGDYGLVCKLIDHNSNEVSTIQTKITGREYRKSGDMSDIEFIQSETNVGDRSPFLKRGLAALPSVERSLDGELQKLGFYTEVYAGDYIGQKLTLRCRVESKRQGVAIDTVLSLSLGEQTTGVREFLSLADLSPEEYDFHVTLVNGDSVLATRTAKFHLKWTLSSLIKNDFEYAVDQLRYVIKKEEKKELMSVADTLRLQAFEEFWRKHDPTPQTVENELREEYYRRIRYANQYYSTVNREGWETDRGMIYIRFGEPDQIERHPFEMESKPSQIWYYYTQRRTFAFIDTRGDGDYQLQYPYDGDWRKSAGQ
jgi:GWxTD domain-containing protein